MTNISSFFRQSFAIIFLLATWSVPAQTQETDIASSFPDSSTPFHPLQIGNAWVYSHHEAWQQYSQFKGYKTSQVIGDTLLGGRIYSVLQDRLLYAGTTSYEYLRFDSGSANVYMFEGNGSEHLYDSLSCATCNDPTKKIAIVSNIADTVFGMTLPTRTVYYSPVIDGAYDYKFAYGIGLVESGSDDGNGYTTNDSVVYALVKGHAYGANPLPRLVDSLAQYYPMHLGDQWTYRRVVSSATVHDTVHLLVKITGDTVLGTTHFAVFHQTNLRTDEMLAFFQRFDSSNGTLIRNGSVEDNVFVDKPLALFQDESLQLLHVAPDSVLGLKTLARSISAWMNPGWFGKREYAFGLGLVRSSYQRTQDSSETCELVQASIQGKEFGTSAVPKARGALPRFTQLLQNYPNPFNPSTTIRFILPYAAHVKIELSNVLGEDVATLVEKRFLAGTYAVKWEARNLPSGVYLCRLITDKGVETMKLLLLR